MPINSDFSTVNTEKLSKHSSGTTNFATTMAANRSGNTSSEAQSSNNSNKNIENSLIKHQGQKWQQFFDFDKMLKQIRVAEKQHHRHKGEGSSNNGKSTPSNLSATSSKSNASTSKGSRSLRQVQRLNGNDMHYYGIVPKKITADVIVCSICRGIYTMVGFNNHMMMQHPSAWGAASSKLSHASTSNEMYTLISNDNSQDCVREISGGTAPNEILGSPSDLSGVMSTSSNASSSSSSVSTTSSTYAATPRHKSSKSSSTTPGSSSGGSSSTSGSRSRSKQSRHNSSNAHAASVGIHTSSTTSSENAQPPSKSSKKGGSSSSFNTNNNKNENANNTQTLVTSASTSSIAVGSSKHSKDTITDTVATTPIALYSSSSNSSCSLPPTPKLSTNIAEVKSPAFVAQESADSSVSSSSGEYEGANSSGKALSSKSSHTANATKTKANTSAVSCSIPITREASKVSAVKDITNFESTQLSELDQAVSSITECTSVEGAADKKVGGSLKHVIDATNNVTATNNIFQMPNSNPVPENNNDKLHQTIATATANNMNVTQATLQANYVVPQEIVQACEDALPHNTSDDNSILTFDDVFDSKFINEILSTADTEIHFDENELDAVAVSQQQQQQEQHQVYQQQQVPSGAKRMRYDETILASGPQQQLQHQQQGQGVEITGEFVAYQQEQYVPYNVATLEDLKMFNGSGPLVDQHQQIPTHLQHATEQQQLTAIDAMQLQQLLYQQQTLNTHYNNSMVDDPTDATQLAAMQQQQYDQNGIVSAKQLIDMCATVDMKSNKLGDFSTISSTDGAYVNTYDNMAAHFQLYNVPSLTDDNLEAAEHVPTGGEPGIIMPNIVGGMQRTSQQYVLPGGAGEDHLIYEITDNNQVAVISQQRQQQMLTDFLTNTNYDQVATEINAAAPTIDTANAAGSLLQQTNNGMPIREAGDENDDDLLEFDYSLLDTVKSISSSSSSSSGTNNGGNSKTIKTELNTSGSSASKYYEDVYLNAYLYTGIPKPIAINCFGLIKLPFAAATTFRKNILNARKANNSPITLSGGGINGIVCSNSSAAARLSSNTKSMPNYFGNSASNSLAGNEFSIGSITITNSSLSQSQLYAAQQKQHSAGNNSNGGVEITFNATSNGCSSAVSPVSSSSTQRSRAKSGNSSAVGGSAANGGATLVRSKSQTGTPVAVVTPTSRLPPPPRPSTAGPVLAHTSKTIFVSNTPMNGNDRVKLIKRCMPLVNSSNNNSSRNDGSKRQKFSPRQIADFLGGVSHNKSGGSSHKSLSTQQSADSVGTVSGNNNSNNHDVVANNNSSSSSTTTTNNTTTASTTNSDEQLKLERVARFYERRRKLYDLARNTRQQQQQQQQQRTQPSQVQQKLLQQQQQLFKMLSDYGQLNANCKSVNVNPSNNNGNSEILRISV